MFHSTNDLKSRGRAKKWISLCLSVCLLSGSTEAAAVPSTKPALQTFASISIPSELGAVQEFHPGTSGKTVIYIKDAHDVLQAQENIAALIAHLIENQNVKTVYEEGYEGALPTDSFFQDIAEPELKKKVSYYFLDQLKIGGAEYAHINRNRDFKLLGADSFKDHFENVVWYAKTLQTQADVEADLLAVEKELENLTKALGLKPLQNLQRAKKRFEEQKTDFVAYLREVSRLYLESPAGGNLESAYPAVTRMLRAIDTKQAELLDSVNQQGEAAEIFSEMQRLEDALAEALLKNARDRQLYEHTKAVRLLRRLNKMEVTPAEYQSSKKILDSFRTQDLAEFLAREGKKMIVLPRRWEESLESARNFYETALRRDEKIREAMTSFAANTEEKTAVLVYGGFHAEGIRQILEKAGIGYAFVSPKIQHFEQRHQDYYRQSMGRGSQGFPRSAASRMARPLSVFQVDAYGEPDARKAARDELRRLKAFMVNLSGDDLTQSAREARLALSRADQSPPNAQIQQRSELRIAEESAPEERAGREIHAFMQSFKRRLAEALLEAGIESSEAPAVFQEALRSLVFWNSGLRQAARSGGLESDKTGALILMFNHLAEAFYNYHYGLAQKVERESADDEGKVYKAEVVEALRRVMSDADIDYLGVPQFIEMYEDILGEWRGSGQFDYLMNHYLPYMFTAERERVEQFMAKTSDNFPRYLNLLQTLMWFYEEWGEFSVSKVKTYGSSFDAALEIYEKSIVSRSELRADPDEEENEKTQTGGLSAVREPIAIHDIDADPALVRETMKAAGKTLSREEQQILFRALHARNIEESLRTELFNYLIEKNINLVRYTAKKMGYRSQEEDWPVIQEGVFGLMVAVKRFDYEVGTMFSTYAYWWIRRAIQGGDLDEAGPMKLSLHYRKKRSHARRVFSQLTLSLGHEPSIEEWAAELDISTEDLIKIISTGKRASSLDAPVSKDSESSAGSFLEDPHSETPDEILSWGETRAEVLKLLGFIPFREQVIIKMRHGIGTEDAEVRTLQEIGEVFKISRERIRQLETRALQDLSEADKTQNAPYAVSADHADVYLAEKFGILPDSDEFLKLQGTSRAELEKIYDGKFTVRFMNKDVEVEIPGIRDLPAVVAAGYERIRARLQAFALGHRVTLKGGRVIDLAISPTYVAQYPEILALEEDRIEQAKIEFYELLKSDASTSPFEVLGKSDAGHLVYWILHAGRDLPAYAPDEAVLLTLTPQERRVYELSVMLARTDADVEEQLYAEGLFNREKPVGFQTRGLSFIRTSALSKVARGKNGLQLLSEATGVSAAAMTSDLIHAIDNRYWRSVQYTYGIRVQKTHNAAETLQKLRADKVYKWGTEAKGFFENPQDVEILNREAFKILREGKTGWDELNAETGVDKTRLMSEDFRHAFPERYWKVLSVSYGLEARRVLSSEERLRKLASQGVDLGNESTLRNTKLRALKMARGVKTGREQAAEKIGVDPAWITNEVIDALPENQKVLLKARYGIGMHRIWYETDKGQILARLGVTYKGKPYGRNAIKELTDRALANLKHILLGEDTIEVRIKKFLDDNRYQPPIMQQVPEEYGVTREAITRMWKNLEKPESALDDETAKLRRVWYALHPLERRIIQANFGLGEEPAQSLDEISARVKADPELKAWAPSAGKTTLTRSRREAFEAFRKGVTGWTRLGNDIGENRADLEVFVNALLSEKEIDLLRAVYGIEEPRAVSMEHAARLKGYKSGVQVTGKKRDLVEKIRRALVNEGLSDPAILEIRKKDMSARKSAGARVWTDQKIREKVATLTDEELNTAALNRLGLRSMLNAAMAAYGTWDKALLEMGRDPAKIKKKGKLRTADSGPENPGTEEPGTRSELRAAERLGAFREIRTYEDVVSVNEWRVQEALNAGAITPEKAENYKKTFRGIRRVSAKALQIYADSAREAGLPVYPVQVVWVGGRIQGNRLKQLESPELGRDSDIDLVIGFSHSEGLLPRLGKYESLIAAAFIQALSDEDVPGALDYEETLEAAEISELARGILARYSEETESKTRIQLMAIGRWEPLLGEEVQGHPLNNPELLLAGIEAFPEAAEGDELQRSELRDFSGYAEDYLMESLKKQEPRLYHETARQAEARYQQVAQENAAVWGMMLSALNASRDRNPGNLKAFMRIFEQSFHDEAGGLLLRDWVARDSGVTEGWGKIKSLLEHSIGRHWRAWEEEHPDVSKVEIRNNFLSLLGVYEHLYAKGFSKSSLENILFRAQVLVQGYFRTRVVRSWTEQDTANVYEISGQYVEVDHSVPWRHQVLVTISNPRANADKFPYLTAVIDQTLAAAFLEDVRYANDLLKRWPFNLIHSKFSISYKKAAFVSLASAALSLVFGPAAGKIGLLIEFFMWAAAGIIWLDIYQIRARTKNRIELFADMIQEQSGSWTVIPADEIAGARSELRTGALEASEIRTWNQREKDYVRNVMNYTRGIQVEAAGILGIDRSTLSRYLKVHLADDEFKHEAPSDFTLTTLVKLRRAYVIASLLFYKGNQRSASRKTGINYRNMHRLLEEHDFEALRRESAEFLLQKFSEEVKLAFSQEEIKALLAKRFDSLREAETVKKFERILGVKSGRIAEIWALAGRIRDREKENERAGNFQKEEDFKAATEAFKQRIADGETEDSIFAEAAAVFKAAARFRIGQHPSEEQVAAAIAIHRGSTVEKEPGEGKTLSIALAAYVNALTGRPAHIHTFNSYLAGRDAQMMGFVFDLLGMRVSVITDHDHHYLFDSVARGPRPPGKRHLAAHYKDKTGTRQTLHRKDIYKADIVYGVKDLFVFDFLYDQTRKRQDQKVQPFEGPSIVILDEGDGTLLDESGYPLIVAYPDPLASGQLRKSEYVMLYQAALALKENSDYTLDPAKQTVNLHRHGLLSAIHYLKYLNFDTLKLTGLMREHELGNLLRQALMTRHFNERDGDYILRDGKIQLVDEFTGRIKSQHVLGNHRHQFIAAKETHEGHDAELLEPTLHGGLITYQNYYRMIQRKSRFSIITGTMGNDAPEIEATYGLQYVSIPKQAPSRLMEHPPVVTRTKREKDRLVIGKIAELQARGNPVLVFVKRISDAHALARKLEEEGGLAAAIIDGLDLEQEIQAIANAGKKGQITIATSVAGRGVNIKIGDEVRGLGGLAVIMTRKSRSRRIDDQAKLRTARRGDPGEVYWFLSEEDEFFRLFGEQSRSEEILRHDRKQILFYDDELDPYRTFFYEARDLFLALADEQRQWTREKMLNVMDLAWQRYLTGLEHSMYRREPEGYLMQVRDGFRFVMEVLENAAVVSGGEDVFQSLKEKTPLLMNGDHDGRSELRVIQNTLEMYDAYPQTPKVEAVSLEDALAAARAWGRAPEALDRKPVTLTRFVRHGGQGMNLTAVHTPGPFKILAVRANAAARAGEIYHIELDSADESPFDVLARYLQAAYPEKTFDLEAGAAALPSGVQDAMMITVHGTGEDIRTVPPSRAGQMVHSRTEISAPRIYNQLTGQSPADGLKLLAPKFRSLDPRDQERKRSELRSEGEWDLRAAEEWRKPGIPEVRLFDDLIGSYMKDFPAVYETLQKTSGRKVGSEEFFEFMTHLSVARLFQDRYRGNFAGVISDLLREDELLLAMFRYTLRQDLSGTYKKFNAYSELANRFMSHESWYLDLVRRQVDALGTKHLVVAVVGPSFGQELFFWAWIIQRIKTVPGYRNLTYEIIGYEKFEEMAKKSRERIAGRGLDILDVVAAGRGAPEEVLRSSFDLMEAAQTRPQEFSENIRVVTGDAQSPALETLFSRAGIISFNNVWAWMNAAERKSVITKLKRAAVNNPDVIVAGMDVLGGEFQDLKIPKHHPSFRSELRATEPFEVPDSGTSALAEFYRPLNQPGAAMIDFRDLVTFTPEEIREAAVVMSQRTEVRFVIHDAAPENEKFLFFKELFKSFSHVVWTQSSGNEAFDSLGPKFKQKGVIAFARKTRDLSGFDAQALNLIRFFAVAEERPGTFAAALSYDPEQRLFQSGVIREGAFYVVQPLLADLASRYLAQFAFAASA